MTPVQTASNALMKIAKDVASKGGCLSGSAVLKLILLKLILVSQAGYVC